MSSQSDAEDEPSLQDTISNDWMPDEGRLDSLDQSQAGEDQNLSDPEGNPAQEDGGTGAEESGEAADPIDENRLPDDSPAQDDHACVAVPAPEPVDPAPFPGESPPGKTESTSVNGFQDVYLYDNADYIKVGVRRDWGGSIIFYGLAGSTGPGVNGNNAIDANDTGREVQVAFYDPDRLMQNCAWDAACATRPSDCPGSITFLGWDPVQGGNRCNRGSGVENVETAGGVLSVTTNPLFWNPAWDRTDCFSDVCGDPNQRERRSDVRVVERLRFIKRHVLELDYTVINLANLTHRATYQEMPTVYTANGNGTQDLWRLFNSSGEEIPINEGGGADGFFHKNFQSPGGWAQMQNDNLTYGVGLYTENHITGMQGWQKRSLPFNNFRPLFGFGIGANGVVRARAYLLIGNQDTIAAEAAWLESSLPPFGTLDTPEPDANLSGIFPVSGWVLDNQGIATVSVLIDSAITIPLTTGISRPDVCQQWPGYPNCDWVGFSGSLDSSQLSPCQHLLEISATDTHGNSRIIGRRRVSISR